MLLRYIFNTFSIFCLVKAAEYVPYSSDPRVKVFVYRVIGVDGTNIVHSLPVGATISHCNIGKTTDNIPSDDRKLLFRIGTAFVDRERKNLKWTRCMTKMNSFVYESSFLNCPQFDYSVLFAPIFDLQDEEIILITCKIPTDEYVYELFIEDYPRLQAFQLFSNIERNITFMPEIYLPHGFKTPCFSNFPLLHNVQWSKVSVSTPQDYSKGQYLFIDLNLKAPLIDVEQQVNVYQCSFGYKLNDVQMIVSANYRFYVQVNYIVDVIDRDGLGGRVEFDVGETIQCSATAKANFTAPVIWYNATIILEIFDASIPNVPLQKSAEVLTIESLNQKTVPLTCLVTCTIFGNNKDNYKILSKTISIISSTVTVYTHATNQVVLDPVTNMACILPTDDIYLFKLPIYELPLSKSLKYAILVNPQSNFTVTLTPDQKFTERYFLVCIHKNEIYAPIELDLSKLKFVMITSVYPGFERLPLKQMKGFIYSCMAFSLTFKVEWQCPKCSKAQYQKIERKDDQTMLLHIISDMDMTITYECVGKKMQGDTVLSEIKHNLLLNIYGDMTPSLRPPKYFYATGDPVPCVATRVATDLIDSPKILLPAKVICTSAGHTFTNETRPDMNPLIEIDWTPQVPVQGVIDYKSSAWKCQACCLRFTQFNQAFACITLADITVIVEYSFEYNYKIPTVMMYPGNTLKCCVIRTSSVDMKKKDGNNNDNCLASMIIFYANTDRSATPDNPGTIVAEGTSAVVPAKYLGMDITKAATFVKCYVNDLSRKASDLKRSAIQLQIKSCDLSPPPLIMLPEDQSLFLVNNTISCIPDSVECKKSLLFNFIVERGGVLIDTIVGKVSIVVIDKYLGKNIRVTCDAGATKAFKDISVERVPHMIDIVGLQKIMTINSVITCSSDGYPEPHIVWTQINGSSLLQIDDYAIIIRNWDRSGDYEFTCTAFNKHGEKSEKIKFKIFNVNMRETYVSTKFYVVLYLELFLYHCLLVVVVYFLFRDYLYQSRYPVKATEQRQSK